MPASMPENHSTFTLRLPESSTAGRKPSRELALVPLTFLLAAAILSAQERRIQLDDLAKVATVSDPQISPDGKSIVCVVSRLNLGEDRTGAGRRRDRRTETEDFDPCPIRR
jgi:hypothetical protein